MDQLGPNGKVSKKQAHLSSWTTFFVWTGLIEIHCSIQSFRLILNSWPIPCCSLLSIGVTSNNTYIDVAVSAKLLAVSAKICSLPKISTHETARIISLIKSNLSCNSNTSQSYPTSSILNECETPLESGMERDLLDLSRSICPVS